MHKPFPSAQVDHIVADGERRPARRSHTSPRSRRPGHTPGALSWHWGSCDGGVCRRIVYADSLSPVSRDNYRFSRPSGLSRRLSRQHRQDRRVECEILLTPHPSASQIDRAHGRPRQADRSERLPQLRRCAHQAARRAAGQGSRRNELAGHHPVHARAGRSDRRRRGSVRRPAPSRRSSSPTSRTRPGPTNG